MATKTSTQLSFFEHFQNFFQHNRTRAVFFLFLAHGFMISSWFAQIPSVKSTLQLSDSELGNVLLAMPLGTFVMNLMAGVLLKKFGAWRCIAAGYLGYAISVVFLFMAKNYWLLFANLLFTGWTIGILIVVSNTLTSRIEKSEKIFITSSCHAGFSFGALAGAAISGAVIANALSPLTQIITIVVIFTILIFSHRKHIQSIPPDPNEDGGITFGMPNRELFFLIIIGLAFIIGEGIVVDWSSVYLKNETGASAGLAPLGYGVCAMMMMVVRLGGDMLVPRFGVPKLLLAGGVIAFLGIMLIIFVQVPVVGIVGFGVLGLGIGLGVPLLMILAARVKGFTDGGGVALFTTFAFTGFILEPPMVGRIAEISSLELGFGVVAVICLLGGLAAYFFKRV